MAHPHADVRQSKVEHSRVAHITRGYATGGAVTAPASPKVSGKSGAAVQKFADGGAVKQRLDRPQRAKGGRVGKTTVNVIVAPQGDQAKPPMPPVAGLGPAGPVPPPMVKPPMMPPPGVGPMAGPGGPPPGMPMPPRSQGGRTYATGGAVKRQSGGRSESTRQIYDWNKADLKASKADIAETPRRDNVENVAPASVARKDKYASGGAVKAKPGPAFEEGKRLGTQVTHSPNKSDGKDIGRGRVITYATGGAVEAPKGKGPKMPGGGRGGLGRLAKAKRAAKNYAKPA